MFQGSSAAAPATPGSVEAVPDVASEETAVAAAAAEIGVPLIPVDEDDPVDTGSETAEIEPGNAAAPAAEAPRKRRARAPRAQSTRPRRSKKTA